MNKGGTDTNIVFIVGIVVVTLVLFVGGIFLMTKDTDKPTAADLPEKKVSELVTDSKAYSTGPEDSKVILTEFSDFQCPACAYYAPIVKSVIQKNPEVKLVYRHFPLKTIHLNAERGAEAAEAAGAQGKFWEMHDLLFANQEEWVGLSGSKLTDKFIDFASKVGVADLKKFRSEIEDRKYRDNVSDDVSDGEDLGLNATPTFFINDKQIDNLSEEELNKAIEAALQD